MFISTWLMKTLSIYLEEQFLTSDEILHDKVFDIAKNSKYDGYQCELPSVVKKIFDICKYIHIYI